MTHCIGFVLCLLAFASLALSMERHQDDLLGHALSRRAVLALRVAGWLALVAALAYLIQQRGTALGLVDFSGHTSFAAGVVVCVMILYNRLAARR